jgi:hypothetical protein
LFEVAHVFPLDEGGPESGHLRNISDVRVVRVYQQRSSIVSCFICLRARRQEGSVATLYENYGRAEDNPEILSHSPEARIQWLRKVPSSLKQVSIQADHKDIIQTLATTSSN